MTFISPVKFLPVRLTITSEIKVGIVTRGDGATERGYNDQYGTDYYENGDESDYYGIVRYARQKGILGVIIEHQSFLIQHMLLSLKTLGDNSKVDYIGWADAWAIWGNVQF